MTSPTTDFEAHGWSLDDTALYVSETADGQNYGLWIQQTGSTRLIAVFVHPDYAAVLSRWLDEGLARTGMANAELTRRLRQLVPPAPGSDM